MKPITSLSELQICVDQFVSQGYRCFLLHGELGVGKTAFTKCVVKSLGGNADEVQSPTYTYMNTYATSEGSLLHIDMYRLETKQDAFDRGLFEEIDNHDSICIERPKREENYRDSDWISVHITLNEDGSRTCEVDPTPSPSFLRQDGDNLVLG